jgi:hypothetical protein
LEVRDHLCCTGSKDPKVRANCEELMMPDHQPESKPNPAEDKEPKMTMTQMIPGMPRANPGDSDVDAISTSSDNARENN